MLGFEGKRGIYCLGCKSDLHDVLDGVCPRCGREFDLDDVATFADVPYSRKRLTFKMMFLFVVGGMLLALLFMPSQEGFAWGLLLNLLFGGVIGLVLSPVGFFILAMNEWSGKGGQHD